MKEDYFLSSNQENCPFLNEMIKNVINSNTEKIPKYPSKKSLVKYEECFKLNLTLESGADLWRALSKMNQYNIDHPQWVDKRFIEKMEQFEKYERSNILNYDFSFYRALTAGTFLYELNSNIKNFLSIDLEKDKKGEKAKNKNEGVSENLTEEKYHFLFNIYMADAKILLSILNMLDFDLEKIDTSMEAISIELWENNNKQHYLRILSFTTSSFANLEFPLCPYLCTAKQFFRSYMEYMIDEISDYCLPWNSPNAETIVMLTIFCLLFVFLLFGLWILHFTM